MGANGYRGHNDASHRPKSLKRKRAGDDLDKLNAKVAELEIHPTNAPEKFPDLPLSQATLDGLKASHFETLTTIQSRAIPVALKNGDILGAAKTGSGKTLAFLVPVLENLFRKQWTEYDGLGALILSPTRELAIQIFEVLRKIGRNHTFSAGLVIGGKNVKEEKERLGKMNILVATPGRILQHMDQAYDLDVGNLQMLVLDEADRIMDMGFKETLDAIIGHLPQERQTLMFSATQTRKVSDLARLSLKDPEFVSVHETAESATPAKLQQNYIVTPLAEKLDILWSFIRANVKKKIIVFLSSGKQVRFVYEAFRHLQPGISLLHLHGRQKQRARLDITNKFSSSRHACLFSTDVAARGLDFPSIDWVVQLDCPEDADTYIHRVGRTARYERDGRAALFLDPSEEEGMLAALAKKKVTLEKISVRQKKMQNTIKNQLQNMCFTDPELKYLGQKAFISYTRSIHIQKDKDIFNLKALDLEAFAASLGLPGAPRVKFIKGEDAKARKNMPRQLLKDLNASDTDNSAGDGNDNKTKAKPVVRTKYDRMFERRNQDVLAEHYSKMIQEEESGSDTDETDKNQKSKSRITEDADSDNDFLSVKHRFEIGDDALGAQPESDTESDANLRAPSSNTKTSTKTKVLSIPQTVDPSAPSQPLIIDSSRRQKLLTSRKKLAKFLQPGTHVVFSSDDSDDNTGHSKRVFEGEDEFKAKGVPEEQRRRFLAEEGTRMKVEDDKDREVAREKRREKKIRAKERARAQAGDDDEEEADGGGADVADAGAAARDEFVRFLREESNDDSENDAIITKNRLDRKQTEDETRPAKRPKKWFEDASSGDDVTENKKNERDKSSSSSKSKRRREEAGNNEQPKTLEDLEALAASYLAQ